MTLEPVDKRETPLAPGRRGPHLPRREATRAVAGHGRPVANEKAQRRDPRVAHLRRPDLLRAQRLAHVVPDELAARGPNEQVLASPVEAKGGDLAVELDRQRDHRLILGTPTNQRLPAADGPDGHTRGP